MDRSHQLDDLVKRCVDLQTYPETETLARQLHGHLCKLEHNFREAHAHLRSRLIFLQV